MECALSLSLMHMQFTRPFPPFLSFLSLRRELLLQIHPPAPSFAHAPLLTSQPPSLLVQEASARSGIHFLVSHNPSWLCNILGVASHLSAL